MGKNENKDKDAAGAASELEQANSGAAADDAEKAIAQANAEATAKANAEAETKRVEDLKRANDEFNEADSVARAKEEEARVAREEAEKLRPFNNKPQIARSAHELFPDEDTVTMTFPKDVMIQDDKRRKIQFKKGVQEVPVSLKDHWYLNANGVTEYTK